MPCSARYLLTSLSMSQLLTGLLITMWGVYPTLTECWPYGKTLCQIQAVLRGSFRQQTAFALVLIAFERCTAQVNIDMYKVVCSKPLTIIYIILKITKLWCLRGPLRSETGMERGHRHYMPSLQRRVHHIISRLSPNRLILQMALSGRRN